MASAAAVFIGSLVAVLLLSSSASARPCKTILISYSFSIDRNPNPNPNPNPYPNLDLPSSRFLIFTSTSTYFKARPSFLTFELDNRQFPQQPHHHPDYHGVPQRIERSEVENENANPLGWFDLRSFRDRAVDILSVVLALLFGVGCGALTAATMFLVWSLCSNNRSEGFEEEEEEEEDLSSIKKMGYVKISDDEKIPETVKA